MPSTMMVGLQDPQGTISKSGRSASGSLVEIDLIDAVTVPSGDEHHLCEFNSNVGGDAEGTIFRIYGRSSSSGSWTQIGACEVPATGIVGYVLGTSIKVPAGHQWKVTGQQSAIGRMDIRIGGAAKVSDVRDY